MRGGKEVAIVGMALRVPGAQTPEMFWHHVAKGTDCLTRLTVSELRAAGVKRETLSDPRFVAAAPMLPACAEFDADLFGMTAYEAERTDPAHRLFLECCFEALEHAAIIPAREPLRIGVAAGADGTTPGTGFRTWARRIFFSFDWGLTSILSPRAWRTSSI